MYVIGVNRHPARGPCRTASRRAPPTLLVALLAGPLAVLALTACGTQEDWSPLDGPWDPNHPDAPAILAAPDIGAPVHTEMADAGERWYRVRGCLACHTMDGPEIVGPSLRGVSVRREYEWFRGMVMNPDSMFVVDPEAQRLLAEYPIPMPDQGVDELRTRALWEYLRAVDLGEM